MSQDGSGAGLKSSNALLIASHFPPIKDSVFQVTYIMDDLNKFILMHFSGCWFVKNLHVHDSEVVVGIPVMLSVQNSLQMGGVSAIRVVS